MAIVKSELIKQLKKSYPNFENKILTRVVDIILKEIKESLYGLGNNPKLAGADKEEDTDQGGSGESDKAAS